MWHHVVILALSLLVSVHTDGHTDEQHDLSLQGLAQYLSSRVHPSGQLTGAAVSNATLCELKINDLFDNLIKSNATPAEKQESIAFFDAAGKPGSGLSQGNFNMMGSYDLCKTMENSSLGYYKFCKISGSALMYGVSPITIMWMGCLPDMCREANITELEEFIPGYIKTFLAELQVVMVPSSVHMWCEAPKEYDTGAYLGFTLCGVVLLLVLLGSVWYWSELIFNSILYSNSTDTTLLVNVDNENVEVSSPPTTIQSEAQDKSGPPESYLSRFFKCFALQKTFPVLVNTETKPSQVLCLNGIRVMSINWVVLGHSYIILMSAMGDPSDILPMFERKSFTVVLNALPSVDSFFVMSGFLVSYLLLKQLATSGSLSPLQWVSYYVHRYLRLTVPFLLVVLMQGFLYRHWVSGPFPEALISDHKSCKDYWWASIFYINNFVPWDTMEMCIAQSWYLANDFQFYIIAPFFIILLFKFPKPGVVVGISAIAASAITAGTIAGVNKLGPSPLSDSNQDNFRLLYNKPWVRISPYIIGILGGWFYWRYAKTLTDTVNRLAIWKRVLISIPIWVVSIAVEYAVVFGLHDDIMKNIRQEHISEANSIAYESLAKIAWGLALLIQIIACQIGLGGVINSALSWKGWLPLARLTYGVYLLHFGLAQILIIQSRHLFYFRPDYEVAIIYIGILVMSYSAAALLYTCVEQPLANIEAMSYRKRK